MYIFQYNYNVLYMKAMKCIHLCMHLFEFLYLWKFPRVLVIVEEANYIANSIWEARIPPGYRKPGPDSPREEKERFIKAKYERKEWLAGLPGPGGQSQYLVEAICRCDMAEVSLALAHCKMEDVNSTVSNRDMRTPLHLAAALGNLPITQLLIWVRTHKYISNINYISEFEYWNYFSAIAMYRLKITREGLAYLTPGAAELWWENIYDAKNYLSSNSLTIWFIVGGGAI